MLAPEKQQSSEGGVVDRMADAILQAQRIQEYLPRLYHQLFEAESRAAEIRKLIAEEKRALADLRYEGAHVLSVSRDRYKRQGRLSPI